jgi:hypothetical protein
VITVPLPDGLGKKTVKMLPIDATTEMDGTGGEHARRTVLEVMK